MTHIDDVVAAAVIAERERCAKIAEAKCGTCSPGTDAVLAEVAAAIREGAEEE